MTLANRESRALRLAPYNIHKCRGMDGRIAPQRIAGVLRTMQADVVALQEVVCGRNSEDFDQLLFLARELDYPHWAFGETRKWRAVPYGNATLSRLPILHWQNVDVTQRRCERRACLRTDLHIEGHAAPLHLFNTHLGTAFLERRAQGHRLLGSDLLANPALTGPRIMLGDFNEWTHGLCSRMLCGELARIELAPLLGRARSYPGVFPLLHLDQIYYERSLQLLRFELHRTRAALIASDHLPLSADFALPLDMPATPLPSHTPAHSREEHRQI